MQGPGGEEGHLEHAHPRPQQAGVEVEGEHKGASDEDRRDVSRPARSRGRRKAPRAVSAVLRLPEPPSPSGAAPYGEKKMGLLLPPPENVRKVAYCATGTPDADTYLSAYALSFMIGRLMPGAEVSIIIPDGMSSLTQRLAQTFPYGPARRARLRPHPGGRHRPHGAPEGLEREAPATAAGRRC